MIYWDVVVFGDLIVVKIMCVGDFYCIGVEVGIRVFVGNDWD